MLVQLSVSVSEAGPIPPAAPAGGSGGATASAIGSRLARVATHTQLLVVTHSPQVAAAGTAHFRISKEGGRTRVEALEGAERTEEIARMLSGTEITAEARAQAARLLDAA